MIIMMMPVVMMAMTRRSAGMHPRAHPPTHLLSAYLPSSCPLQNERNVMMMVDHPFVLKLETTFKDAHCLYMLLEYVQGGELFSYLSNSKLGYIPVDDARFYAACVLAGVGALHDKNILYRDLKPENMMIDREGYIKVVDMGFAKVVRDRTYTLCGTPEYLGEWWSSWPCTS